MESNYQLQPIGVIHSENYHFWLEVLPPFRPGLKQLDQFSHVNVFWWADQHDNRQDRSLLQCEPPYATDETVGVFCVAGQNIDPIQLQ